jgi:hypothetical protein
MPQSPERKSRRIELVDEAYYEVDRSEVLARWTDISPDGLFIQTMHPLPVGQQVKLKIRLQSGSKLYRAVGVVRHRLEWVGMGVEFTHLHPEARRLIQEISKASE